MSRMAVVGAEEQVVLVDEHGRELGIATKASVHNHATPLHLGFSCYLFSSHGRVLITRRALSKTTWPGVWTNSFCGHPRPTEPIADAVRRRAHEELGVPIEEVRLALPQYRYRAVAADGIVENEICPVFCATVVGPVRPAPAEVMDHMWVSWSELRSAAALHWAISPWAAEQIPLLDTYLQGSWPQFISE